MRFKRFTVEAQDLMVSARRMGLCYALVIKADDKDYEHEVVGVACCEHHLDTEDGEYRIVYIPDLKGFNV